MTTYAAAPAADIFLHPQVPEADGDDDSADVEAADIVAGNSIVHVIDEVLIPASLRRNAAASG